MMHWEETLYDLLVRASTDLPADVEQALRRGLERESPGSNAEDALATIIENTRLARQNRRPICQDTGTILVYVDAPPATPRGPLRDALEAAVRRATAEGILRQNCVDTVSGTNTGDNIGPNHPVVHWDESDRADVRVAVMLKGGGCENVGIQYSLPNTHLSAGRDLEGVRRCLLDAVHQAQGRGCSPGVLGVAVGGDRITGCGASKRILLRHLGERSSNPELAALEEQVLADANALGIGPMGFGGETTLLDLLICAPHRHPASYFVSVSYMCWCYRRHVIRADLDGTPLAANGAGPDSSHSA